MRRRSSAGELADCLGHRLFGGLRSTGEAATLDEDEWLRTIHAVVDAAAGRVPVWAGCTHNCTRTAGSVCQQTETDTRRGRRTLSQPVLQQGPPRRASSNTFMALAQAVDPLPVVLYNVPDARR